MGMRRLCLLERCENPAAAGSRRSGEPPGRGARCGLDSGSGLGVLVAVDDEIPAAAYVQRRHASAVSAFEYPGCWHGRHQRRGRGFVCS
jgi:hypothetical protein